MEPSGYKVIGRHGHAPPATPPAPCPPFSLGPSGHGCVAPPGAQVLPPTLLTWIPTPVRKTATSKTSKQPDKKKKNKDEQRAAVLFITRNLQSSRGAFPRRGLAFKHTSRRLRGLNGNVFLPVPRGRRNFGAQRWAGDAAKRLPGRALMMSSSRQLFRVGIWQVWSHRPRSCPPCRRRRPALGE